MDGYGLAKSDLPTDYDARKVHPECTSIGTIRDQCGCGSCFAFGAIEAFEDRICIHLHKNVTLSVEDIISCHEDENMSCQGGNPIAVWQNIFAGRKEGDGAVQDSCYPYSIPTCPCNHHSSVSSLPACPPEGAISTPTCDFSKKFSCEDEGIYRAQSATLIPAANMEQELVEQGPITVAYTVYDDFLTYKSGVYSKTAGAKALGGHSVKIIGYGVDATSGLKYWTVANSWNAEWGDGGFFKIRRGTNECNIESDAVVAGVPAPSVPKQHIPAQGASAQLAPVVEQQPSDQPGATEGAEASPPHIIVIASQARGSSSDWSASELKDDPLHEVILGVRQRNVEVLEKKLRAVSEPSSAQYGQYLSFEQVGALVRNEPSLAAVRVWLGQVGVPAHQCHTTTYGEYLRCSARVSVWNAALSARFRLYTRRTTNETVVRAPQVHVPRHVRPHLAALWLGSELPTASPFEARAVASRQTSGAGYCDGHPCCTPAALREMYNISGSGDGLGSQSVFETAGQTMSAADLLAFQTKYGVPHHKVDRDIGGGIDDDTCKFLPYECGEANLDIQYITAVAQDVPTTFWSTSKQTTFAHWIADVATTKDAPLVHSVSYGQLESETDEDSQSAFNTEVMKLGVRGITVLASSGDDGVSNPKVRSSVGLCGYTPQWPASSPYVTTVGATQGPEEGRAEEVVCSSSNNNTFITSGGGFSNAFTTPRYQAAAVSKFLANGSHAMGGGYNAKGRGYPDVALVGHLYPIVVGGSEQVKDGTSASTPVMAAIIALVNSRRLANGKPSVGFANPALYSWAATPGIFRDITQGKNNCCSGGWSGSTVVCCPSNGFYATPGWDATSGLGSVNVGNLVEAWAAL